MIEIIDTRVASLTEFEKKYFSVSEAPDTPRRNVKRIKLKASDNRHYDFTKGAEMEDDDAPATEETPEDDTTEDTPEEDTTTDDDDVVTGDDEDIDFDDTDTDDGGEDTGDDDDIVTDDEDMDFDDDDMGDDEGDDGEDTSGDNDGGDDIVTDDEADGDTAEDTGDDAGNDDGGDDGDDDIVTDDDADIEDDGGDDSTADQNNDGDNGDNNGGDDENKDDFQEGLHKQNLYRKFVNLHTAIDHYSSKLSTMIGVDNATNHMYTQVNDKLKELKELLYDYMVLKFKKNKYVESMLFYQRSVATTNICLDMLADINNTIRDGGKPKKIGKNEKSRKAKI